MREYLKFALPICGVIVFIGGCVMLGIHLNETQSEVGAWEAWVAMPQHERDLVLLMTIICMGVFSSK